MKIHNVYGSNKRLKKLCKILGVTDISEGLDRLDEKMFERFLGDGCCAEVCFSTDAPEYHGVYLVKKRPVKNNPVCSEELLEEYCVAYLCTHNEGPCWEKPLDYLKEMLNFEIMLRRDLGKKHHGKEET